MTAGREAPAVFFKKDGSSRAFPIYGTIREDVF
jgi:hypothetical protein